MHSLLFTHLILSNNRCLTISVYISHVEKMRLRSLKDQPKVMWLANERAGIWTHSWRISKSTLFSQKSQENYGYRRQNRIWGEKRVVNKPIPFPQFWKEYFALKQLILCLCRQPWFECPIGKYSSPKRLRVSHFCLILSLLLLVLFA